jgi:hypothetical protein
MALRGVALALLRKQASQPGVHIHPEPRPADGLGQRRGARQLRLRRLVGFLREPCLAAPAQRARFEFAQAVRLREREQFVRERAAAARVAPAERDRGQSFETPRRQIALAAAARPFERVLQRRLDVLAPKPGPRDRAVRFDANAPEIDAAFAAERETALHVLERLLVQVEIEEKVADEIIGDELVAHLLQALEPAQGFQHAGPRYAVVPGAGTHVIEPEQRGTYMPLQVRRARNLERLIEVRQGTRVVSEPFGPGVGMPDHHQVLGLVALVSDVACELERPGEALDRRSWPSSSSTRRARA